MDIEQSLRQDLAACYRIFDYLGWTELIYNHITVKIPGDQEHFLINPYGLHYSEICASNLIKVDIHGNVIGKSDFQPNPAGMLIHSAVHDARPDVGAIAHVHTTDALAVACSAEGLRADNFYSVLLHQQVAYHDFQGITVSPDEKVKLVKNIGNMNHLILRNHGILSCGSDLSQMFMNIWLLQRACEVQVAFDSTNKSPAKFDAEDVLARSAELVKIQQSGHQIGALEFSAMVRLVEKLDDSFKN